MSCLGSKNHQFVEHLLHECDFVGKILEAEKNCTLAADESKVFGCAFIVFVFSYVSCFLSFVWLFTCIAGSYTFLIRFS